MVHIGQIFRRSSTSLGVPVLTPEYEIVLALLDYPQLTAEQLFDRSSLSRAGFFITIDRLKAWGILIARPGVTDRRNRIYQLSDGLRQLIYHRLNEYRKDYRNFLRGQIDQNDFITKKLTTRREKGLDYFSTEFKILFYLYLCPGLSNRSLQMLIDASRTKFHVSLRTLLAQHLVTASLDPADKRIRLYDIGAATRSAMGELHAEVFRWLDLDAEEMVVSIPSQPGSQVLDAVPAAQSHEMAPEVHLVETCPRMVGEPFGTAQAMCSDSEAPD
jgi:DNA-binding MarR family transcriptional regulator